LPGMGVRWPVRLIITMIKWIRTSMLSTKNSLSLQGAGCVGRPCQAWAFFRTANSSSQGQNMALTGLFVPSSLDSGGGLTLPGMGVCSSFSISDATCSEFPAASEKVALYVLWGARCREAREIEARERGRESVCERGKRLHAPFALHAPIQWAI